MKEIIILLTLTLFATTTLSAQVTFSGILDSTVSLNAGAGEAPKFNFGIEEFANLRLQARIKDRAVIYGAVNLIAAVGNFAANVEQTAKIGLSAFVAGENYLAGIELERLYFRLLGKYVDFDGGLMRLPFGYGQIWGPSDFLNPRNPLKPDARARGIIGGVLSGYPTDELKLQAFFSAPRDPFSQKGEGLFTGISIDQHWNKVSLQGLYSYETPGDEAAVGVHRFGISVKADLAVGIYTDMLYTYNHEKMKDLDFYSKNNNSILDGFSFCFGLDYSIGKFILLAEYLFNGGTSSTASGCSGSFINYHYLYTGFTVNFTDFTNMSAALMCSFNDVSFTPIISVNHELFQGAVLTISAQVPMDRDLFHKNGKRGELGPIHPELNTGNYFSLTTKLRFRF